MALNIGELVGYIDLDASGATKGLDTVKGAAVKAMSAVSQAFKSTDLTSEGEAAGDSYGDGLSTKVKLGAAAAATAVGTVFGASVGKGLSMDVATDKVAAALDLTVPQAKAAGTAAANLYAGAWAEGTDEASAAVEAVISSIKGMKNASTADIESVTKSALILSSTMGVDVVKAASTAGNMVHNGIAKDGGEAFDLLAAAMSKVPVQLREDILDATDEYGQFFSALGIDGPAAMGMLAEGAAKGMYGIDKAGDAVKEFTIRATDMSTSSKAAYEAIGLDAGKMANDILAGGDKAHDATQKIVKGLLGIKDPAKLANTSIALFGTPLEDLSAKDIPKFLKSMQDAGGSLGDVKGKTEDMGKTLSDNASSNLTSFKNQVQMAFVDFLGAKAVPAITSATGWLSEHFGPALEVVGGLLGTTTGFLKEHEGVAITLAVVLGTLAGVTAAHGAVMAVAAAGGMAQWLMSTKLISGATKVWTAVQWAFNAAMAANPLVLVAALLIALGVALYIAWTKSEKFRAVVTGAMDAVKAAGKAVGHWFTDTLPGLFGDAFTGAKNKVVNIGGSIIGWVGGLPGKAKDALGDLTEKVRGVWDDAMTAGKNKVENIGGTIMEWITGIPGKIAGLGAEFGKAGRDLLQEFINGMKNAAGVIEGIASNVWSGVKGLLNGAIDDINAALEFTIKLPGPDLRVDLPNIPHLATGGRATAATLAVIGEGREPESVLPDSVLRGLLDKAHAAGVAMAGAGNGGPLIGQVVQREGESTDELANRLWFYTRKRG